MPNFVYAYLFQYCIARYGKSWQFYGKFRLILSMEDNVGAVSDVELDSKDIFLKKPDMHTQV